jgi:DNA-directed RNA polymerase subunit beta'
MRSRPAPCLCTLKIKARYQTVDEDGAPVKMIVRDDAGPDAVVGYLPKHPKLPFSLINRPDQKRNQSR